MHLLIRAYPEWCRSQTIIHSVLFALHYVDAVPIGLGRGFHEFQGALQELRPAGFVRREWLLASDFLACLGAASTAQLG